MRSWDLPSIDALWARLHKHFSEPELVEIGYFVAITMGQQRWLRTLNIEHHQILACADASMAPGFETMDALTKSKSDPNYWAKKHEAVKWYRKAADQGNASAQISLGFMYGEGHGVPQDNVRAHMWFSLAAAQGNQNAVENRDIAARLMTRAQIAEAQKLTRGWKPTKQPHR